MDIQKDHYVDKGEQDEQGYYDYYYEYYIYTFTDKQFSYIARRYVDTPEEASFMKKRIKRKRNKIPKASYITPDDFADPLFQSAISYLKSEGVLEINYLSDYGYLPILEVKVNNFIV